MTRQEANIKIATLLLERANAYPTERWGQLLRNVGVIVQGPNDATGKPTWVNSFNEESEITLKRIKSTLTKEEEV